MATKTVPALVEAAHSATVVRPDILDLIDILTADFGQADAVLEMLSHVFGGDCDVPEPRNLPWLARSISAAAYFARRVGADMQALATDDGCHEQLQSASSLADEAAALAEMLDYQVRGSAHGVRFSDQWMCDYFDAIAALLGDAREHFERYDETRHQRQAA